MPFTKICLGIKISQRQRFIPVENSLYSLIADGKYWRTSLGRNTWKSLIGTQASLQRKCNKEGFNVVTSVVHSKARIGVIANEQTNCNSCDSRIDFGTGGFPDDSNTCGNITQDGLRAVNGNKKINGILLDPVMDCCDNLKKIFLVCVLLFYLLCTCDAKVIDILKKNRYYWNFPRYLELLRRQNMTKLNKEPKIRKTKTWAT